MALGKEKEKECLCPSLTEKAPGLLPPSPELGAEAPEGPAETDRGPLLSPQAGRAVRGAGTERLSGETCRRQEMHTSFLAMP